MVMQYYITTDFRAWKPYLTLLVKKIIKNIWHEHFKDFELQNFSKPYGDVKPTKIIYIQSLLITRHVEQQKNSSLMKILQGDSNAVSRRTHLG